MGTDMMSIEQSKPMIKKGEEKENRESTQIRRETRESFQSQRSRRESFKSQQSRRESFQSQREKRESIQFKPVHFVFSEEWISLQGEISYDDINLKKKELEVFSLQQQNMDEMSIQSMDMQGNNFLVATPATEGREQMRLHRKGLELMNLDQASLVERFSNVFSQVSVAQNLSHLHHSNEQVLNVSEHILDSYHMHNVSHTKQSLDEPDSYHMQQISEIPDVEPAASVGEPLMSDYQPSVQPIDEQSQMLGSVIPTEQSLLNSRSNIKRKSNLGPSKQTNLSAASSEQISLDNMSFTQVSLAQKSMAEMSLAHKGLDQMTLHSTDLDIDYSEQKAGAKTQALLDLQEKGLEQMDFVEPDVEEIDYSDAEADEAGLEQLSLHQILNEHVCCNPPDVDKSYGDVLLHKTVSMPAKKVVNRFDLPNWQVEEAFRQGTWR